MTLFLKEWMNKKFDPFEGESSFKECIVCKESFPDRYDASMVCLPCYQKAGHKDLVDKFIQWALTTIKFPQSTGSFLASGFSTPKIERLILLALIHKPERKSLYDSLLKITGNAGDQLSLAECLEELSQITDGNEEPYKDEA